MRVADAVTDGRGDYVEINGAKRHAAGYLRDFLFTPEQFKSPVKALSGGEKARLALAAALAKPSNLLVLDEPTNDLDLETLELLEEMVADYPGTALVVSHDRAFLDRIATSILAPAREGGGRWLEHVGGYSDLRAEQRTAPARGSGAGAPKPARTRAAPEPPPAATKLSFKEKFALERLPAKIEALSQEVAALKSALADPALFSKDAAGFSAKAARLAAAEAELAAAEAEWLALELKREETGRR
jgi:ATP-binding cassette subfamily F protein uup